MLRYYYPEHLEGYERIKAEGKTAWAEIHGQEGFDNFCSRAFLETVLPRLTFSAPVPTAFEYGCGTGPGACFLEGYRREYPDATCIAGRWYLPYRRHLRSTALEAELATAGFTVVFRDEQHAGSVACISKSCVAPQSVAAKADEVCR